MFFFYFLSKWESHSADILIYKDKEKILIKAIYPSKGEHNQKGRNQRLPPLK